MVFLAYNQKHRHSWIGMHALASMHFNTAGQVQGAAGTNCLVDLPLRATRAAPQR